MTNQSLQSLHFLQLPVSARSIAQIGDLTQLAAWFQHRTDPERPFLLLGAGSNVAFVEDFDGDVLQWGPPEKPLDWSGVQAGEGLIRVPAGYDWNRFAWEALQAGCHGLENLVEIPGTVGAAPIQNIGAYGREVADFIQSVGIYCPRRSEYFRLTGPQCAFGYRDSLFKKPEQQDWIAVDVEFHFERTHWQPVTDYPGLPALLENVSITPATIAAAIATLRWQKLPRPEIWPNVGSFFKNPLVLQAHCARLSEAYPSMPHYQQDEGYSKVPAAWLLDQAGLKGIARYGWGTYEKQPLVILKRDPNADGQGLLDFARYLVDQVEQRFGIRLEPEVRLIGAYGYRTLFA